MSRRRFAAIGLAALLLTAGCAGRTPVQGSPPPLREEFGFEILGHATPRQEGRTLNIFVRYRYRSGLTQEEMPDYRQVRRDVLDFLGVRPEHPAPEYWEILNRGLVLHLKERYAVFAGLSVQIQVCGEDDPSRAQPGTRSSIVSVGHIEPVQGAGPATGAGCPRTGRVKTPIQ